MISSYANPIKQRCNKHYCQSVAKADCSYVHPRRLGALVLTLLLIGSSLFCASSARSSANTELLPSLHEHKNLQENQQEYLLGRAWLRALHSSTRIYNDALVNDYLSFLVYQLLPFSDLQDRRVDTVIVDNPALNAFAVPGGVIGINAGLFIHGENEHEFAAVIAHEIAHLSQRHFARGRENNLKTQTASLATLFAGILLAAVGGSADAGLAVLASTQAASVQSQLAFSRQGEREADRVGIKILADAGLDPQGMPRMFERMHIASRYSKAPPEYLSTHPITDTRITDAAARADQYTKKRYADGLDYGLMQQRVKLHFASSTEDYLKNLNFQRSKSKATTESSEVLAYGLVIANLKNQRLSEAKKQMRDLLKKSPNNIIYLVTDAEIDIAAKRYSQAIQSLKSALQSNPGNYPLMMTYAHALEKAKNYMESEHTLKKISKSRPLDPFVWYQLAEVRGLNNNILGVHEARSEFFFVRGQYERALRQLDHALKVAPNHPSKARIERRITEINAAKNDLAL